MTVTRSSAAIRAELTENTQQFNAAREEAITFERLQLAAAKAAALHKKSDELRAELIAAEAREDKERKAASYANLRNMTVTAKQNGGPSVLAATYIIRFEQNAYSSTYHQNVWGWREVNGFGALTPEQIGYLIEVVPEQIPTGIMTLAPGNPIEAFRLYNLGLSRGQLRG